MVKNYNFKIHFIITILKIIVTLLIIYFIISKKVFAAEIDISYEEAVINLKELVHNRLLRFINQEDFKYNYIKETMWLYYDTNLISEQDVINFIKTRSWPNIIEKIKVNHETVLSEITKEFAEYCKELIKERYSTYLQNRSQAYISAFKDCNNLIEHLVLFMQNNIDFCGWICAFLILYKMYLDPSTLNVIFEIIEYSTLNPSKPHVQRLLEIIPHLAAYLNINNSSLEINNISDHILTPNAKAAFQNTVQTVVDNKNTNIVIIGSIICVGIFIASLKYFAG